FLSGPAFAFDEHRGARGRDLLDDIQYGLHHLALAEDALHAEPALDLSLQLDVFLFERASLERALDEDLHLIEIEGLRNKIVDAALHRLHGGVHRAVGRHHDTDGRRGELERGFDEVHAALAAKPQVREHDVHGIA